MCAILCSSEIYTLRLNSKTGFHLDFSSRLFYYIHKA